MNTPLNTSSLGGTKEGRETGWWRGYSRGVAVLVAAAVTLPLLPAHSQIQFIVNGDFEQPVVPSGSNPWINVRAGQSTIPGWTVVSGNVDIGKYNGSQWVDLNGSAPGEISQRVIGMLGQGTLGFVRVRGQGTRMEVRWNGALLKTFTADSGSTPIAEAFDVTGTGNDLLSFRSLSGGWGGFYVDEVAVVGDPGGSVECSSGSPTIIGQSQPRSVPPGSTVSLAVAVSGECPMTFRWHRNGQFLPDATEPALTILTAQAPDAGDYYVEVANSLGVSASTTISLRLTLPQGVTCYEGMPKITRQPSPISVPAGYAGTFELGVEGECPMRFQWFRDGEPLTGRTDPTLTISDVHPADLGQYHVEVSNALGTALSDGAPLRLAARDYISAWTIVEGPVSVAQEGTPIVFGCGHEEPGKIGQIINGFGGEADLTLVWSAGSYCMMDVRWNGVQLRLDTDGFTGSGARITQTFKVHGTGNDELLLQSSSIPGGSGVFYLYDISLTLPWQLLCDSSRPAVTGQTVEATHLAGETATLGVGASGECPMAFQWHRNGVPLPDATLPTLTLWNVQPSTAGEYSVVINNDLGDTRSAPILLNVIAVRAYADGELLIESTPIARLDSSLITLRSEFPAGSVFYTLDGSAPSFLSSRYGNPFRITTSATIRALAYNAEFTESQEVGPFNVVLIPGRVLSVGVEGQGSVQRSPALDRYADGTEVLLTAVPGQGWRFRQWHGDLAGNGVSATILMDADRSVTAVFEPIPVYTLATATAGGGSIAREPSGPYYEGTDVLVRLTATPLAGWTFRRWIRDATGTGATTTVRMDGSRTVVAVFDRIPTYELTASTPGGGTIQLSAAGPYLEGTVVELAAIPMPGWQFLRWVGDAVGSEANVSLTMNGPKVVQAVFGTTLTTSTTGPGTVRRIPSEGPYPYGATVIVLGEPMDGHCLAAWGGAAGGIVNPLAFKVLQPGQTISCLFAPIPADKVALSVGIAGYGKVEVEPARNIFSAGEMVTLRAVLIQDSTDAFGRWSGDLNSSNPSVALTMDRSKSVTAHFVPGFSVDVAAEGRGGVTRNPDLMRYAPGQEVAVTVLPDSGWHFFEWTGDASGTDNPLRLGVEGDTTLVATLRAEPGLRLWEFSTRGGVSSSPAIGDDGTVYVGSYDETLYALDGKTGSKTWEFAAANFVVHSSPAVGEYCTVYVGSSQRRVYAIDGRMAGALRWEFATPAYREFLSSPALGADWTVYAGSNDRRLYALDSMTGAKHWEFSTGGFVRSSPALGGDGTVYVGSDDGRVYALDGNSGLKRWEFATGGPVASSPALGGDGTLFVGSNDGKVYAIEGTSGLKRWEFATGGAVGSSPAIGADGTVFVGSNDGKLYALFGNSGLKRWDYATGGAVASSPAVAADGTVYVGSNDKKLHAIDGSSGVKRWEFPTTGAISSSPAIGADGTVYVGSLDGRVYAIAGTSPLANSPWPMFRRNALHTGRSSPLGANEPPIIMAVGNRTVEERRTLVIQCSATDADLPSDKLAWSLTVAPSGAVIDADTGRINWTPTEVQGPGDHLFIVRVMDSGVPALSDEDTFTVAVTEANEAPTLAELGEVSAGPGKTLSVRLTAADPDLPANSLEYELVSGPAGATVDRYSGWFAWLPPYGAAGTRHAVTVRVRDNGSPPLSDEMTFAVAVGADMTWETLSSGVGVTLWGVEWGAGRFVAVAANGSILTSTEGQAWTAAASPTTQTLWGIKHDAGRFVVVGDAGTLLTSVDGVAWGPLTSGTAANLTDVAYGAGRFVVVGTGGTILTSESVTGGWTARPAGTTKGFQDITFGGGYFVASGAQGLVATSSDGIAWTVRDAGTTAGLPGSGYGFGRWWVGGAGGALRASANRADWETVASGVTRGITGFGYGHGRLLAVGGTGSGMNGGFVQLTRDGGSWEPVPTGVIPTLYDIAFNGDTWVAVGEGGAVVRSTRLLPPWELAVAIAGDGTVGRDPDLSLYPDGTAVTLTAAPAPGWEFGGWSGAITGLENPITVEMTADRAETATFQIINKPPVLSAIADQVMDEGGLLELTIEATDPDQPGQALTFSLVDSPVGVAVEAGTGRFRWQTGETDGPGVYTIRVRVTDDGVPAQSAERTFQVTVREVNRSPVLAEVGELTATPGEAVTLSLTATDPDLPANTPRYEIVAGPQGATVEPLLGRFSWVPPYADAGLRQVVTVRVSDQGDPPLSDEMTFTIQVAGADMAWEVGSSGGALTLWGVEWGAGKFVAVGANGTILATPDGLGWTAATSPVTGTLWGLSYGAGRFVVAGDRGTLLTSVDGLSGWVSMTSGTTANLTDVAYGAGRYVVVGTGGTILTSETGAGEWTAQGAATSQGFQDIVYGGGWFVASGTSGLVAMSLDGIQWTVAEVGTTAALPASGHGIGRWWVGGAGGVLLGSADRSEWLPVETGLTSGITGLGYGHGRLVAIGGSTSGSEGGFIQVSQDGVNWQRALTGPIPRLYDAAFNGALWLAVGESGAAVRTTRLLPPWALEVAVSGLGSVEQTPPGVLQPAGATVTLRAMPEDGWVFSGWSGALAGTDNPAQVVMSGDRNVGATFSAVNRPPVWAEISEQEVAEGEQVEVDLAATDPDRPVQQLTYALGSGPAGATLDAASGVLRWQTGEADGGQVFTIEVRVTDNGEPPLTASATFNVTVREVNTAPVLNPVADQTVAPGDTLVLNLSADDADQPANELRFELVQGPVGAEVDPASGRFTWTATEPMGDARHRVEISVTDDGDPPLSDTVAFDVLVAGQSPVVVITSPVAGVTADERVVLAGTVTDNVGVASVNWERDGVGQGNLMLTEGGFQVAGLRLRQGENRFRVVAQDAAGNVGAAEVVATWEPLRTLAVAEAAEVAEGRRTTVPVEFASQGDVGGLTFMLQYEPGFLRDPDLVWGAVAGGATATVNATVPGEIRATLSLGGGAMPAGTHALAAVTFRARSVPFALVTPITPVVLDMSDPAAAKFAFGTDTVSGSARIRPRRLLGDNNGNDRLDVGDGTLVQRLLTRLDEVRAWDITGNDLNQTGDLDSGDVTRILRVVVGLDPAPTRVALAGGSSVALLANDAASGVVQMALSPASATGGSGALVTYDVVLTNVPSPVTGVFFRIEYPVTALRLLNAASHVAGPLVPVGTAVVWNVAPAGNDYATQTGVVSFVASSAAGWPTVEGVVARLTFEVQPEAVQAATWALRLGEAELSPDGYENVALTGGSAEFRASQAIPPEVLPGESGMTDEGFVVAFHGRPGETYVVEASPDLLAWTPVATVKGGSEAVSVLDPIPPVRPLRFYRVRLAE